MFDSFYFQSQGGAVLHGLVDGDVVYGPLWDGNLEVLDSATALVHGNFYAIEADGLVVARMDAASPLPPTPAGPGFLGFVTMVAASNVYDVYVFNSSSVATGDFYSALGVWGFFTLSIVFFLCDSCCSPLCTSPRSLFEREEKGGSRTFFRSLLMASSLHSRISVTLHHLTGCSKMHLPEGT
jgi:hypothetical protein